MSLRENAMKIINFKKKKMKLLTKGGRNHLKMKKNCFICKDTFENKYAKNIKYGKVRGHCHYTEKYRGAVHSICSLNIMYLENVL